MQLDLYGTLIIRTGPTLFTAGTRWWPTPDAFSKCGQGARTDLVTACDLLRKSGKRAVAEEMPATFVKYHRGLEALENILAEAPRMEGFAPQRQWQTDLLATLDGDADRRKIQFVFDGSGNKGKSYLASYLIAEKGGIELSGRVLDMAYVYNGEPIAIFDMSRTQAECCKHFYQFAEMLKNGRLLSTKYEPKKKFFKPPHVVFFSNFMPDPMPWSADRIVVTNLSACAPF